MNLLNFAITALALFLILEVCPMSPLDWIFSPRTLPSLLLFNSLPLTTKLLVLNWAIGIILNLSGLVFIFHFLLYLLILSISLSTFTFIMFFYLLWEVTICVISSAYNISRLPGPAGGKSFVNIVYNIGDKALPWGTPLSI